MNGSIVQSFNQGAGSNNSISFIEVQPNGKILIAGSFNTINGTARSRIARLNADGSLDNSFYTDVLLNKYLVSLILQPDGKIIIARSPTNSDNYGHDVVRINSDGSLDPTFNAGLGANNFIFSMALVEDGKILVAGAFTSFNGVSINRIARLNSDGSLDNSFNTGSGPNQTIVKIKVQSNNKILAFGFFNTYNGNVANNMVRINANGSHDGSFNIGAAPNNMIRFIDLRPDGKILIGGAFTTINGIARNRVALLNEDGSLVPGFRPMFDGPMISRPEVFSSLILPDGKILIGGTFSTVNGVTSNKISRLNSDGSLDVTFNSNAGSDLGVYQIKIHSEGGILIAGNFTGYNNLSTPGIARIHGFDCPTIPTPTISGDNAFCQNGFSRLTSSSPTGNLWNTGDTTQFINVAQAGSYTVRVSNNGCFSQSSTPFAVVNTGPSPTGINFDITSNRCLGARVQLTPAGNFDYYNWNTGESTRSIYTRTSGQYSVQVANSNGCFGLPSPPIFINFDTNWCSVEIFRTGLDSITANVWADYYIWYLDGIELLSSNTLKTIPIQGNGVYTFRAVSGGRTSPLSNPIVITTARKSLVTKFEVYPNPATNKVTINTSGTGTLDILNSLGQTVITQPATATNELNISHLAKGVYTVRFNGASKMLVVN